MSQRRSSLFMTVVLALVLGLGLGLTSCNRVNKDEAAMSSPIPGGAEPPDERNSMGGVFGQGDTRGSLSEDAGKTPTPAPSPTGTSH